MRAVVPMAFPWWLYGTWLATGTCLAWIIGATGTLAGQLAGPLAGSVAVLLICWGVLYWIAGRPGCILGSLLQAAASGGAAAALVMVWFSPLLEAWSGPAWLPATGWRLTLAALSGVSLGAAVERLAAKPDFTFPDAAALAQVIGLASGGRRWSILLAGGVLAAVTRVGVAAGWWPGVVVATRHGGGWAGLLGLAVAPGLLGLGMLAGWQKATTLAAGSLAVGALLLPGILEFETAKVVAPALRAASQATGLELQASYAPLIALGTGAVAAVLFLGRKLSAAWRAWRAGRSLIGGWPAWWRRALSASVAMLLGALALWRLNEVGAAPGIRLMLLLGAGALVAALGMAVAAELGSLPLASLGFPALAVAAPALIASGPPAPLLTAGALGSAAALFAADYLQCRRVNLLLEVEWGLYPVKLVSCLAGLGGAAMAAATLAGGPGWLPQPGTGVVGRIALAAGSGGLPVGFFVSGVGLGTLSALLARPVWPVTLGALLPLPSALTMLLGGGMARRKAESARLAGLGLLLGDLLAHGAALFLQAWRILPASSGRWAEATLAAAWPGALAGMVVLSVLLVSGAALTRLGSSFASCEAGMNKPKAAAGNAAASG